MPEFLFACFYENKPYPAPLVNFVSHDSGVCSKVSSHLFMMVHQLAVWLLAEGNRFYRLGIEFRHT
jgi:hypothetical protein